MFDQHEKHIKNDILYKYFLAHNFFKLKKKNECFSSENEQCKVWHFLQP